MKLFHMETWKEIVLKDSQLIDRLVKPFERVASLYNELEQTTDDYGTGIPLFPSEIHAIATIEMYPNVALTELAGYLGITKGTATKLIQKLVKKKMVIKGFAEGSENRVAINLTEQGKRAADSHHQYVNAMNQQLITIYQGVSEESLADLISISDQTEKFLRKLIKERQRQ